MAPKKTPKYIEIDGYRYAACFLPDLVHSAINYKPKPNDVFVATYPKCGTTWTIQMVLLILRKGKVPADFVEYFSSCPFLEMLGAEEVDNIPGPGCIKIHLPFNLAPFSPDAKYIYVARNPKDCCISFYHHTKYFPGYYFTDGTFDDFFDLFIEGKTDFNDYFDNLLSWYEHRNDPNVFFTTFEEMKADHRGAVLKLAKFLGDEYACLLESNEDLLDKIVHYSSFEYMKNNTNGVWEEMINQSEEFINNPKMPRGFREWAKCNFDAIKNGEDSSGSFVRSGKVGEGKTVLTPEQEEKLNDRILEKTKGSDVMDLWKNCK